MLLSDFGFASYMSPWDEQSALRGSPLYMAPEMVCRRQYDSRVDLWSVGVILYGKCTDLNGKLSPLSMQLNRTLSPQEHSMLS